MESQAVQAQDSGPPCTSSGHELLHAPCRRMQEVPGRAE